MSTFASSRQITKGANLNVSDLTEPEARVSFTIDVSLPDGAAAEVDACLLLLDSSEKVTDSGDFVFYNQPEAYAGAARLHSRPESEDPNRTCDEISVAVDHLPDHICNALIVAALDSSDRTTFGDCPTIRLVATGEVGVVEFTVEDASAETALVLGELYRRGDLWKLRAVGQGYAGGLGALAEHHGIDVEEPGDEAPAVVEGPAGDAGVADAETGVANAETGGAEPEATVPMVDIEQAPVVAASFETAAETGDGRDTDSVDPDGIASTGSNEAALPPVAAIVDSAPRSADEQAIESATSVSIRRTQRPLQLPAGWNSTPAATGWHAARLFSLAGIAIKANDEQETRATSTFLSVLSLVREFGRRVTSKLGAPAGTLEAFTEVNFKHEDRVLRPDGLIRVTRGGRTWVALVEVKSGDRKLSAQQVDDYIEVARSKGFDAVVTISAELTGAADEHPLTFDQRKLRKVRLHHLSWGEILTEAELSLRQGEIGDSTRELVLTEFIRYGRDPRSGMIEFSDMGSNWVKVREAIRAKTLRAGDRGAMDVIDSFDRLVRHVGLRLSVLLGVSVSSVAPKKSPDGVSRTQELTDSGELFGSLRVPRAGTLTVNADLRSDRVSCSMTVRAPSDKRPRTKVTWLTKQLADAPANTRIETQLAGTRTRSTAALLSAARENPDILVPDDGRDIRAFTVTMEAPLGPKRATGKGTLIDSVSQVVLNFYATVAQNIRVTTPPA